MIKYLGSKRVLIPQLLRIFGALPGTTVLDLFSGTSRVGHALKGAGWRVIANDVNAYAHALATCYVQADRADVLADAERLIAELNSLPGRPGWFTATYAERSRFLQPKNAARVDAIREAIAKKGLAPELEAVLLVSLMEAADRVDSTTGVQMAYLKQWAPRSFNDLALRMPDVLPRAKRGKSQAFRLDALEAVERLAADVAYVDPPYNQHSYLGNYHLWESLVLWDRPEVYGVACKRIDTRQRRSVFNSKVGAAAALETVLTRVQAPVVVASFSNEGFVDRAWMESALARRGRVLTIDVDFKRYVGAQIGIYNPSGEKVGKVSHLRNTEHVFVAGPPEIVARVEEAIGAQPLRVRTG